MLNFKFRTLVKLCQDRAHDYYKRIKIEFEQWCQFGYPNSDPCCERQETQETTRAVNKVNCPFPTFFSTFLKAQPPFFRCTRDGCGKYRKVSNPEDANPAYFICMDVTDPVSTQNQALIELFLSPRSKSHFVCASQVLISSTFARNISHFCI